MKLNLHHDHMKRLWHLHTNLQFYFAILQISYKVSSASPSLCVIYIQLAIFLRVFSLLLTIVQVKDKILQEKQSAYIVYVNYTSKYF